MENGRVKRGADPKKRIGKTNYRKVALYALRRDFKDRCAYSMQHVDKAGGIRCMDVDHFNPKLRNITPQPYSNLHLASRHCNGTKGSRWPSPKEMREGKRFIDPTKEVDYGPHIVEEIESGELKGLTKAGRFQIIVCDLNAPHLSRERRARTALRQFLSKGATMKPIKFKDAAAIVADTVGSMSDYADIMIPEIPAAPPIQSKTAKPGGRRR